MSEQNNIVSLVFLSLDELVEFALEVNLFLRYIDEPHLAIRAPLCEQQVELAVHGFGAQIKEEYLIDVS